MLWNDLKEKVDKYLIDNNIDADKVSVSFVDIDESREDPLIINGDNESRLIAIYN
jgi:hypothetical protein